MANAFLEIFGFFLSMIGIVLTVVCCVLPEWRTNDVEGEVIESIKRSSGLWSRCTFYNTGNWQCDQYDTFFLGLPAPLQCARAAVCIALVFQCLSFLVGFVAMDCTTLMPTYPGADEEGVRADIKRKMILAIGGINIFCGVVMCVGVSYYASTVLQEYNIGNGLVSPVRNGLSNGAMRGGSATGERYIYGQCLFIGWVAMIIDLLAGAIMICSACGKNGVGTESMYGTAGRLMGNPYQPSLENIVNGANKPMMGSLHGGGGYGGDRNQYI